MLDRSKLKAYLTPILNIATVIATIFAAISLIIDFGEFVRPYTRKYIAILDWFVVVLFIADSFIKWGLEKFSLDYIKRNWPDFALISLFLVIVLFVLGYSPVSPQTGWAPLLLNLSFIRIYVLIVRLYVIGSPLFRVVDARRRAMKTTLAPAQLVVLSFIFVILMGTSFLLLPGAVVQNGKIRVIDALFTATSATCVTGLIVVDTGSYFTRFGQIVILILIQIGGLGLMTITTFFALIFGRDMNVRENIIMSATLNMKALSKVSNLVVSILILTFSFELLGAILLYFAWLEYDSFIWGSKFYYCIFHSISAFCNAGFSLFPNSFENFKDNIFLNMIITSLIIFGGLGFAVLVNIYRSVILKKERLSLHTKLVLVITASLIFGGMLLIALTEWNNNLSDLPDKIKIMASYFLSITPRTAGFNTINMRNLTYECYFLLIILMFIGASPGGTGGGIKTSTFGLFLGAVWSMLQGRSSVEMFKRNVSREDVNNALLLTILALMLLAVFGFILLLTQVGEPMHIFFELFSAFGTVGLSAGITPQLTTIGKIIIIITMFIGRVGPLTLLLAIRQRRESVMYEYPEETIMIG